MNKQMSMGELRQRIIEFLKENRQGSLATCVNNVPRSSPVQYFLGDDLDIYILSAGGKKFDAIRDNPNVCLLVNTPYLSFRKIKGVQVFGKAVTSMHDPSIKNEAKRYIPVAIAADAEIDNIHAIKIVPEEIVYLDALIDGDRTKQIFTNSRVTVQQEHMFAFSSY